MRKYWPPFHYMEQRKVRQAPGPTAPGPFVEHWDNAPFFPFHNPNPDGAWDRSIPVWFSTWRAPSHGRDPLVFDLAGTGLAFTPLETSQATFAYRADQPAVSTAWIGAGQGILVQDLHPAALQVTADELLGAVSGNGLAELAALDSNHDGKIDAQDTAFASLKIWRDANLNGVTDAGELVSLTVAGIASIDLASQQDQTGVFQNGVQIAATFRFTRTDGSLGNGADVNFPAAGYFRYYVPASDFAFVADASLLPQLIGYGMLPDLAVAITKRPDLLAKERQLVFAASAMSGKAFAEAFEQFIFDWAGIGALDASSRGAGNDARHVAIVEAVYGQTWSQAGGDGTDPVGRGAREYEQIYQVILDEFKIRFAAQVTQSLGFYGVDSATIDASYFKAFDQIGFDNQNDEIAAALPALVQAVVAGAPAGGGALDYWEKALPILRCLRGNLFRTDATQLDAAFQPLAVAAGLALPFRELASAIFNTSHVIYASSGPQTVLGHPVADLLVADEAGHTLSGGEGNDFYVWSKDVQGTTTISDNSFSANDTLLLVDLAPADVLITRNGLSDVLGLTAIATGAQINIAHQFSDGLGGNIENFVFADGTIWSTADLKRKLLAQQSAQASGSIYGFWLSNDVLVAGTGDKYLDGGGAGDTYIYSAAGGNDTIHDPEHFSHLVMSDILSTDARFSRLGDSKDLLVQIASTGKSVIVRNEFSRNFDGPLTSIDFADGVSFDVASLKQQVLAQASASGQTLILGFEGSGDVLVAGMGDRYLNGAGGYDTYVYSAAGGNDTIHDPEYFSRLVMSGINSTDATFSRIGSSKDLLIQIGSTGKSVVVQNEFSRNFDGPLTSIDFQDGVSFDVARLKQMVLAQATASGQTLILGFEGSGDVLVAGGGDRYLNGTGGADSYVYSAAGGNDTISDPESYSSLSMSGINSSDVVASRIGLGNDLLLTIVPTGKTLTLVNEFSRNQNGPMTSIHFEDGVSWTQSDIEQSLMAQQAASGQTSIYGFEGSGNVLVAGTGDRYLNGAGGYDTYVYSAAGGNVTIHDPENHSVLTMAGIASTDVEMFRAPNYWDLIINNIVTGKTVTVVGHFTYALTGTLRSIDFADGVSLDPYHTYLATLNHAPRSLSLKGGSVAAHAGAGTIVAELATQDVDEGDAHQYALAGPASALFAIAGNKIVVALGANIDASTPLSLDITCTDAGGLSVRRQVQIGVTAPAGALAEQTLAATSGNNVLNGAATVNRVDYSASATAIYADLGVQRITHDGGKSDRLSNIQNIIGTNFGDRFYGGPGDNVFVAGTGQNIAYGIGGHDRMDYSRSQSMLYVDLAARYAQHDGTTDWLSGISDVTGNNASGNRFYGTSGNNVFTLGTGQNIVYGEGGSDTADYSRSSSVLYVDLGAYYATHDGVTDYLTGIANVTGNNSSGDRFYGTSGNNVFTLGTGQNIVYGLGGADTVDYSQLSSGISADLAYYIVRHNGTIDYLTDISNVAGSAGDDWISGLAGGHSALSGGAGNDTIIAHGHDTLTGGTGADEFRFASAGAGSDLITDFISGQDHLAVLARGFAGLQAGDVASLSTGSGGPAAIFGAQATAHFAYDIASGQLWFDSLGAGSVPTLLAGLGAGTKLLQGDLLII